MGNFNERFSIGYRIGDRLKEINSYIRLLTSDFRVIVKENEEGINNEQECFTLSVAKDNIEFEGYEDGRLLPFINDYKTFLRVRDILYTCAGNLHRKINKDLRLEMISERVFVGLEDRVRLTIVVGHSEKVEGESKRYVYPIEVIIECEKI